MWYVRGQRISQYIPLTAQGHYSLCTDDSILMMLLFAFIFLYLLASYRPQPLRLQTSCATVSPTRCLPHQRVAKSCALSKWPSHDASCRCRLAASSATCNFVVGIQSKRTSQAKAGRTIAMNRTMRMTNAMRTKKPLKTMLASLRQLSRLRTTTTPVFRKFLQVTNTN